MDQRRGRRGDGEGAGADARNQAIAPGKRTLVEQSLGYPHGSQRGRSGTQGDTPDRAVFAGAAQDPRAVDPFPWLGQDEDPTEDASRSWAFDPEDRRGLDEAPGYHGAGAAGAVLLAADEHGPGVPSSLSAGAGSSARAPGTGAPLAFTSSTPLPKIAEELNDLSDEELRQRRARLTARLASLRLPPDVRLTIARQRDAIEWLQHQRQLSSGEAPSSHASTPTQDELFEAAPLQGASSLDLGARARLESASRTGGPRDEQQTFLHLSMRGSPEQQSALHRQHHALASENSAFRDELHKTSLRVAQEMLDASTRELEGALLQYGLSGGSFRLSTAAKQYQRDPESLPQIIAEWRTLSHKPERAGALARGAASQAELAATVAGLRARQVRVEELEREERGLTEQDYVQRDAIDPSRSSHSARAELAEAWVAAEEEHPILLAFRDPKYGASVDRLDELAHPGAELEGAVLEQAIPKLANILRTKHELSAGRLDPMRLGPVLELAKQRLLVPPGSQRAQLVAELHRQATKTPLAEHVLSAISLGLSLVSFVPGVGLPAKLLAEAAALALELRAQVNDYKEWRTAGGIDNTALDMARSISASAPELRPLFLRLAVAGASAASLVQLSRLALKLERARQLGGASSAADSVEQILKEADALGDSVGVKKLGEQLEAMGGVRGASVYSKKTIPDGSGRLSRLNLEKVKDSLKKAVRQPRVHQAKLEAQLGEATADAATCTLKLPAPTGAVGDASHAGAVDVHVELRFKGELSPSAAHGADAGPARYMLEKRNDTGWIARVEIDQHLEPRDVEFIIGHELDEIAELVRRYPAGKPAAGFEGEMAAGVMRDGATTAKTTAHDVANAREVVALQRDYENLLAQKSPNAEVRKQTLDRAIESAGLGEASQIDAKVRLLREAGATEELLDQVRRVESRRVSVDHVSAANNEKIFISEDIIDHILWPREKASFLDKGLDGGHHTARLMELSWPNSKYVFVETAAKPAAGTVARRFDQYRWSGEGAIPLPGSGRFPTDKAFSPAGWVKSKMVKTTLDDPSVLLREGEEAFRSFVTAHGDSFEGVRQSFSATTASGLEISGYAMKTSEEITPTTLFVEASWF